MTNKALEDLLKASEDLLKDMRERAIFRGDYEDEEVLIEGGMGATKTKRFATLDCGNSVLYSIQDAIIQAKAELNK